LFYYLNFEYYDATELINVYVILIHDKSLNNIF